LGLFAGSAATGSALFAIRNDKLAPGRNCSIFAVNSDIRRPFNHDQPEKGGFNIMAWPDQYIENNLLPLLIDEGLIESISPRRYRLREDGKRYCRMLDPSI
jgi:hypothetical protein